MFWALAFPLILGTLFYVSFGNTGLAGTGETVWEPVPVAIVTVDSSSANAASFLTFLSETDQDMIDIHSYKTEKAAKKALRREEISGIYYVKVVPSLTIASNGINQSILSSLLESYEKNADMIRDIATQHPEKLSDALASLNDYQTLAGLIRLMTGQCCSITFFIPPNIRPARKLGNSVTRTPIPDLTL